MAKIIELPESVMIDVAGTDAEVRMSLVGMTADTIVALLRRGAKDCAGDANAGAKKKGATESMIIQTVADKLAKMERNEYTFGAGGGGARITPVERECRAIVRQIALDKRFTAKEADEAALDWREQVAAWAEIKGSDPEEQIAKITRLATKNVEARSIDADI